MAAADDKKMNDPGLPPQSTITGIDSEASVSKYSVGCAIDALIHDNMSRNTQLDHDKFNQICAKHKVFYYALETHAWVSRGDGVLGKKEEEFLIKTGKSWGLSDNEINEALKGNDSSKELMQSGMKAAKEMVPNGNDAMAQKIAGKLRPGLLLYAVLAATQDGLVKDEYEEAKKLAKNLGFPKGTVKQMINVIKLEKQLQQELGKTMGFDD